MTNTPTFAGTTSAAHYSKLIHHTLGVLIRSAAQGEAQTLTLRTGCTVTAKMDTKYNTRYTVRRDGVTSRGISALFTVAEAEWTAHAALEAQLNAEIAHRRNCADAANLAAFEGVTDQTAAQLADKPETLRMVAGIARLFYAGTITRTGAMEAMQAAGLAMLDAQAETDAWVDAVANAPKAPTPEMQAFAAAWTAATPAQMGAAAAAAQARQDAKDKAQEPTLRRADPFAQPAPASVTLTLSYADAIRLRRVVRECKDRTAGSCWHEEAIAALAQVRAAITDALCPPDAQQGTQTPAGAALEASAT